VTQFVIGEPEWKFIKMQYNSASLSVSLIFHRLKSKFRIMFGNMDAIIIFKETVSHNLDVEFPFLLSVFGELE